MAEAGLVDRLDAAVYVAHPGAAGRWTYVSPAITSILGVTPDALIADPGLWARQIDPRDRDEVLGREESLGAEGRLQMQYRMVRPGGDVVWVHDDAVLRANGSTSPVLHGVLYDITRRKCGELLLEAHADMVDRVARGDDLVEVLAVVAEVIEEATGASRCVVESSSHDRGPQTLLVSAGGILTSAPQPGPGVTETRTPLIGPDGGTLGSLVLQHPEHRALRGEGLLNRSEQLATVALVRAAEHREMSESVALLRATLESTEDGILVVDEHGRTAGYNQKFVTMWNIAADVLEARDDERMIGSVLAQLVDPDGFVREVMRLYDSPTETSFSEWHFLDGRVFERYSQPQMVDGRSVGRVWSFRDVTDKRRLQQELELLGSVATASNSASSIEGALSATLAAFCRYDGWAVGHAYLARENTPGSLVHSVWHEEQPGACVAFREATESHPAAELTVPAAVLRSGSHHGEPLFLQAAQTVRAEAAAALGFDVICAFPILVRDEVVGVLEFASGKGRTSDDRVLRVMRQVGVQVGRVVERDRSEQRLARHARELERLSRQLDSVLNSAADGIYGVDSAGTITFVNEAAVRMLGLTREEVLGSPVDVVAQIDPSPSPISSAPLDTSADDSVVRLLTGRHRRADGSTFDSELISAPIVEDGAVIGSVVVFRDVSERRAVDRMKDEFISMVSHELRTPLTSIRGALGLLGGGAAGQLPPRAARMVEVATTSTDRLIRLINDILDVERMAVGKLVLHTQPTSAQDLVQAAVEEMAGLAHASDVSIRISGDDGTVLADPDRVVQTLTNLLSNAVKFSPTGEVVEVATVAEPRHIRFDVHDSGSGIPSGQLESIFEHFRQADASDTRQKGGTGLGLAICRGLVEKHGGQIWATSEPDQGSTLSFTLPRADCEGAR